MIISEEAQDNVVVQEDPQITKVGRAQSEEVTKRLPDTYLAPLLPRDFLVSEPSSKTFDEKMTEIKSKLGEIINRFSPAAERQANDDKELRYRDAIYDATQLRTQLGILKSEYIGGLNDTQDLDKARIWQEVDFMLSSFIARKQAELDGLFNVMYTSDVKGIPDTKGVNEIVTDQYVPEKLSFFERLLEKRRQLVESKKRHENIKDTRLELTRLLRVMVENGNKINIWEFGRLRRKDQITLEKLMLYKHKDRFGEFITERNALDDEAESTVSDWLDRCRDNSGSRLPSPSEINLLLIDDHPEKHTDQQVLHLTALALFAQRKGWVKNFVTELITDRDECVNLVSELDRQYAQYIFSHDRSTAAAIARSLQYFFHTKDDLFEEYVAKRIDMKHGV